MKYIIVIKDEQNEISIAVDEIYEATNLIKPFLEKTSYNIEIMKVMEE